MRRGAAEASSSGGVQRAWVCNAVGLTSILDRGRFLVTATDQSEAVAESDAGRRLVAVAHVTDIVTAR